jgi:hypothetical protein
MGESIVEIIPVALSAEILIHGGWKASQKHVRFYEKADSALFIRFYQTDNAPIVTQNQLEANYCNANAGRLELEIYGPSIEPGKEISHYFRGEISSVEDFEKIVEEKERYVHEIRGKVKGVKFGF